MIKTDRKLVVILEDKGITLGVATATEMSM